MTGFPLRTWEVHYKERDLPGGGTEHAVERVTARYLNPPDADLRHFIWLDNGMVLSLHQDVVESIRLVDDAS